MPLIATRGAASAQGFGEFAQTTAPVYIEDVFSTWLYTGTGSARTITNGIDLSTKGGLVWTKNRNGAQSNYLVDTVTGAQKELISNSTAAQANNSGGITSFSSSGYSTGTDGGYNGNADTYVSWTFREQPKFFDVVTYTGNNAARTIAHNLGSVPGCIIIKCLNDTFDWIVWHRSLAAGNYNVFLNTTNAQAPYGVTSSTLPTATEFSLIAEPYTNGNGNTYVAYLFAHNAGGFGLIGSDNVITCGGYTGNGTTGQSITLGYEPQWLLIKRTDAGSNDWILFDNMRGMPVGSADTFLRPNTTAADDSLTDYVSPTATGFNLIGGSSNTNGNTFTYIYIAIRRGPMKTPTTGTSVFTPAFASSSGAYTATAGFPVDAVFYKNKSSVEDNFNRARLTGPFYLVPNSTAAQVSNSNGAFDSNTAFISPVTGDFSAYINWMFRRAPGFFDVVCWTGTGTANRAVQHNLTVAPELLICKSRTAASTFWRVLWTGSLANSLNLNGTSSWSDLAGNAPYFFGDGTTSGSATAPTATNFYVADELNQNGQSIVAYLFASLSGVSKVGSYTGTGTTLQVNCGFTNGSRFVLIKRTDSTGDWYVWDSARGIVAGNDPYLLLNSTAAEVTNTDYVDTFSSGFEISSTAPAAINANGGTFIFLAVA